MDFLTHSDEWWQRHVGYPVYHGYQAFVEAVAAFWRRMTQLLEPYLWAIFIGLFVLMAALTLLADASR